jgi:hypothetical protein
MTLQQDNHYVPCLYLKRFAHSPGHVLTYRTLVGDVRFPEWRSTAIKGVAYQRNLYTRIVSGAETDEIEKWLNAEFEAPAEGALAKATTNRRLAPADWHALVRFLAAQDVRTPSRFLSDLQHWKDTLPRVLDKTLEESVREMETAKQAGRTINVKKAANSEYLPLRVTREIGADQETGRVKAEVVLGRGLWFFTMRHALTETARVLHSHRWTILRPPDELSWFTTDDPVVRLNYYRDGTYDFKGGWGKPGTEIFLPLDPRNLMYTRIGERPPKRGSVVPRHLAETIRQCIAEHAHRLIFASTCDPGVARLRPRIVDASRIREERQQWRTWHEEQTAAEEQLGVSS